MIGAEQADKTRAQRRANAPGQFVLGRNRRMIKLLQGILNRTGDARLGVGQRAVEVEEDRVHGCLVLLRHKFLMVRSAERASRTMWSWTGLHPSRRRGACHRAALRADPVAAPQDEGKWSRPSS